MNYGKIFGVTQAYTLKSQNYTQIIMKNFKTFCACEWKFQQNWSTSIIIWKIVVLHEIWCEKSEMSNNYVHLM